MGTFSKSLAACGGFVAGPADVIDYLRISSRAFLFTASAVPAALGAALAALRIVRSDEGPQLLAAVLEQARYFAAGLRELGYSRAERRAGAHRTAGGRARWRRSRTPIVPVLVGDDWKAALLWRALYDGGVFTNCALYPAVPHGGALLRTSVMATHDRADARPRAGGVRGGQARRSRPSTGRFPGPPATERAPAPAATAARRAALRLSVSSQVRRARKRSLLAHEALARRLTARRS